MNTCSSVNLELDEDAFDRIELTFPNLHSIHLSIEQLSCLVKIPFIYFTEYWLLNISGKGLIPCINEYKVIKSIGSGTYSKVWEFTEIESLKKYAAKNYSEIISTKNRSMRYTESGEELITEYEKVWTEILCHMLIDHPFIAKLHKILHSSEKKMLYLIFEHLPYHCLKWDCARQCYFIPFDSIDSRSEVDYNELLVFTEFGALYIFKQIFQAVLYCHKKSIIHKDIKPENILINKRIPDHFLKTISEAYHDEGNDQLDSELYLWNDTPCYDEYGMKANLKTIDEKVDFHKVTLTQFFSTSKHYQNLPPTFENTDNKASSQYSFEKSHISAQEQLCAKIIDFNSAEIVQNPKCRIYDAEGTNAFSPPETLALLSEDGVDGATRDIWSLGCFLYILVYGEIPFKGHSSLEIYSNIMKAPLAFPNWRPISKHIHKLISSMLIIDPFKRIKMEQLDKLLKSSTS